MRFVNTDLEITPHLAKYFEYIELFESLIKSKKEKEMRRKYQLEYLIKKYCF